jgi:mannose/cellobiose epimerase-like protein (N-acyl-D-glucosamine 2-epimerase family)
MTSRPRSSPGWTASLTPETHRLLDFGRRFPHPAGGATWLDGRGEPDLHRPVFTWITARMTHVYALGHLLGAPRTPRSLNSAWPG